MDNPKSCWECHKKRLVCDFSRPKCQKCDTRGADCPGYDKKPLTWLAPGQTRSKGRRARNESNLIILSLKDTSEASTIFEAIEYYNVHICPDLEATGRGGRHSPFFVPPSATPYLPAAYRQSMVCVALGHRILQSTDGIESDQAALRAKLQHHRGIAIRQLTCDLAKPSPRQCEGILASVLILLLSEIQHSISPTWRHHVDGAYAIIDILGGIPSVILWRPNFRSILRFFILTEVMGSTTSPTVEVDSARRQLDVVDMLPTLYGDGLSTSLPCPPQLMEDIIHVNHLRSKTIGEDLSDEQSRTAAFQILKRIRSFSVENWTAGVRSKLQADAKSSSNSEQLGPSCWDWQCVASTYQSAAALYCIDSLLNDECTQARLSKLRLAYREILLRNLRDIASNSQNQLRKLVIWPLIIAGIEVDARDSISKEFILGELAWTCSALGTASPLVARGLLTRVWSSHWPAERNARSKWGSLFDRPYCFVV